MAINEHVDIVARTIAGESRGCGYLDMLAVGAVIRERFLRPGWWSRPENTWRDVVKASWQFSCWNQNDPNREQIIHAEVRFPRVWPLCWAAAEYTVLHMRDRDVAQLFGIEDPFPTHYHTTALTPPQWAGRSERIDLPWRSAHLFYRRVPGEPARKG